MEHWENYKAIWKDFPLFPLPFNRTHHQLCYQISPFDAFTVQTSDEELVKFSKYLCDREKDGVCVYVNLYTLFFLECYQHFSTHILFASLPPPPSPLGSALCALFLFSCSLLLLLCPLLLLSVFECFMFYTSRLNIILPFAFTISSRCIWLSLFLSMSNTHTNAHATTHTHTIFISFALVF